MTFNKVIAVFTALNFLWLIYNFFSSKHIEKRNMKQQIYADVIASAEEMREAYFEGEPDPESKKAVKGWVLTPHGWLRTPNWIKSERYMETAAKMNQALASLSLVADEDLCLACFHLELIATDCRDFPERAALMNLIVTMMREDLGTFSGNSKSIWGRRKFRLKRLVRFLFGIKSRNEMVIDLPWH